MAENSRDSVVSTGGWFVFMLILCIPIVNLIYILVQAFGSNSNRNKQGYCRAMLLWMVLCIAGGIAGVVLFGAGISKLMDNPNFNLNNLNGMMEQVQNANEANE